MLVPQPRSSSGDDTTQEPFVPPRMLLQWHVTERCNGRCAHCYQEDEPRPELPFAALLDILRQYREFLAVCDRRRAPGRTRGHVTITGGEPFVREDLLDLLDVLATYRDAFGLAILTNGTLIDDRLARYLRNLRPRYVQVSLEGRAENHDRVRGPGNFERVCTGIRRLVRRGVRTVVAFTAHRTNFREFPHVARIARRLGAAAVWADRLVPLGQANRLSTPVLSPPETREFAALVAGAARRRWWQVGRRTRVATHRALQFLAAGGRPYTCQAGATLLTVLSNGDLVPCRRLPIRVGNVLQTPLRRLYDESDELRALRAANPPVVACRTCRHIRSCRGGLRCLAFAVHGDPFRADPGCWLATPPPLDAGAVAAAGPA